MKWYAHILALVERMSYVRDKVATFNYYEYMYFLHVLSLFEYNGYNIVNAAQVMELIGQ